MIKWCIIVFLFIGNSLTVNGQTKKSILQLSMVRDSIDQWAFPEVNLSKDGSAKAYCPCFAYEEWNGTWTKQNDTTHLFSLTDTAKEKRYRIATIDSTPTNTFTTLYFKNSKGKLIDTIHLKLFRSNVIYHSNTKGKVLLLRPYDSYRYNIITEAHPNDTVYAVLQKFSPKMQYTITLTDPKRAHTFEYYLRKEKGLWALYDIRNNNRIAWFSIYNPKIFIKRNKPPH